MNPVNPAESEGPVLVIGAAGIDVKGRPDTPLQPSIMVPGHVRISLGGVARNIAENLARLEIPTILLSAVGDDASGESVLSGCAAVGIDVHHIPRIPGAATGSTIGLMTEANEVDTGIADFTVIEHLTPDFLRGHAALFASAAMVVIDANLSVEALATIFELAGAYRVPVCADPTAPWLAGKLCRYLPQLYMVAPNGAETTALCGVTLDPEDADAAVKAARHLVSLGVKIGIITLGEHGLAYADSSGSGHIPARRTHIVDATGAGDALTAGIIFGLMNGVPLDDAMRLGVSAAALTLRSRESVDPRLSQELLYDELVV